MNSVEPSTRTSKRPRGEASTAALTSGDMLATEELHVNPAIAMDPSGDEDVVDLTCESCGSSLTLCIDGVIFYYLSSHDGQLIDELLTEVATLRANFAKYISMC